MSQKHVTSIDVAKAAGVSQPTVSRAFDPNASIATETRQRVMEIARELGYSPNAIARSLSTQQTNIIGIIMANLTVSQFYPSVLEKFTLRLQEMGKQVLLFKAHPERSVDEILPRVIGYQVDALIVASSTPGRQIIEESTGVGRPVILINRFAHGTSANTVCSDNVDGGRLVADFFLDSGHQRIAYIAGTESMSTTFMREQGFVEQLTTRGYSGVIREQATFTYESGREIGRRLLSIDNPPDAVFCAADIIAMGVMDTARYELGIKIPEELSIVGFDDIPVASWPAYNLTTIRQPIDAMVNAVVDLISRPEGDTPSGEMVLLPGELIVRGSARVPAGA